MVCMDSKFKGVGCGLGPTTDMLPMSTFQNWGNSSKFVLRKMRPIKVMRGSSLKAWLYFPSWSMSELFLTMDLNL